MFPEKLQTKLERRAGENRLRSLARAAHGIDFYSNDYLGFARSEKIRRAAAKYEAQRSDSKRNGATGARLISGNSELATLLETRLAAFHQAEAGLLFNSGYDANVGFFSAVPQRGDTVLYDERIHASVRDGIRLSLCHALKFKHNDCRDLESKLKRQYRGEVYLAVESLYSMEGDSPDLREVAALARRYGARLIVDEAHATGVLGERGAGWVQALNLQADVFARIHTFGKALGAHGAIILGSRQLIRFLLNFAHAFIYTTALPPHSLATLLAAYDALQTGAEQNRLRHNVGYFRQRRKDLELEESLPDKPTPIQLFKPQNQKMLPAADERLRERGFLVKHVKPPTVPPNRECLRLCLHSFNSPEEIEALLQCLRELMHGN